MLAYTTVADGRLAGPSLGSEFGEAVPLEGGAPGFAPNATAGAMALELETASLLIVSNKSLLLTWILRLSSHPKTVTAV